LALRSTSGFPARRRLRETLSRLGAGSALCLVALAALSSGASAQVCQVTANTDAGAGSLRACVVAANGDPSIVQIQSTLPPADVIILSTAQIDVASSFLLNGDNAFAITNLNPMISSVFTLAGGNSVTVGSNVTILNQNFAEGLRILDGGNTFVLQGTIRGDGVGVYANGDGNVVDIAGRLEIGGPFSGNNAIRGFGLGNRFTISGDIVGIDGSGGIETSGNGTIIDVAGTISTTGDQARGIFASGANQQVSISGAITTNGLSATGALIQSLQPVAGTAVTLSGSITTLGNSSAGLGVYQSGNTIVILDGATITTSGSDSIGLTTSVADSKITLAGDISTSGANSSGADLQFPFVGNNTFDITASGSISTTNTNAHGISIGGGNRINVGGLIKTTGSNSRGILSGGGSNTVTVLAGGMIETTGVLADAIRLEGSGNTIMVAGNVTTRDQFTYGIFSQNGGNLIAVSGSMHSEGGNSGAIRSVAGNDRIRVSGAITVTAGRGISSLAGSNTIDLSGSIVSSGIADGAIDVTGGSNTINVSGSIVADSFQNEGIIARGANNRISISGSVETKGFQSFGVLLDGNGGSVDVAGNLTTTGQDSTAIYAVGTNNRISVAGTVATSFAATYAIYLQDASNSLVVTGTVSAAGAGSTAIATANGSNTIIVAGKVSATGSAISSGGGDRLELQPGYAITGNVLLAGSQLSLGGTGRDTFDLGRLDTQYTGYTTLDKRGASTWTLTGANAADWSLTEGTLLVQGSIGSVAASGGILGGTGRVAAAILDGGALAPGVDGVGTLTVTNNIAFSGGAGAGRYRVDIQGAASDLASIGGTATLTGGAVDVAFLPGGSISRRYTVLTAAGGLGGTTFTGVADNMAGVTTALSYDASNVYLDVALALNSLSGLSQNQAAVAAALDAYFMRTGSLPSALALLDADGLSRVSGEVASAAMGAGFQSAEHFTGLLSEPDLSGSAAASGEPLAYAMTGGKGGRLAKATGMADDGQPLSSRTALAALAGEPSAANAQGAFLSMSAAHGADAIDKAFASRWKAWGAAYGGSERIGGDPVVGSADTRSGVWGVASGASLAFEGGRVGFALGGGGSSFDLAGGLGSGRTTNFHAGLNAQATFGDAYLSGALTYGLHATRTSRSVAGDVLAGSFNGQTLSGRVESGYGFAYGATRLTPYAAVQATGYFLPGYVETSSLGGPFAVSHGAQSEFSARTELGARVSHTVGSITLTGRAAWAWNVANARSVNAGFQSLPGTSFTVNGARPARHALVLDAGLEGQLATNVTGKLSFTGEFSRNVTSVGAAAKISVRW